MVISTLAWPISVAHTLVIVTVITAAILIAAAQARRETIVVEIVAVGLISRCACGAVIVPSGIGCCQYTRTGKTHGAKFAYTVQTSLAADKRAAVVVAVIVLL